MKNKEYYLTLRIMNIKGKEIAEFFLVIHFSKTVKFHIPIDAAKLKMLAKNHNLIIET